ncbi:hypothetical protein F5148DRAFT_1377530 [Russula earlei]|uniref:Uncharacterized protein n=1 Tax=Russula earlei TaxID=71964 RepID=A0ACC0U2E8_9AGAM|nr:hypothetical protein F5148DRAFT_1377530 [Russula earlei]
MATEYIRITYKCLVVLTVLIANEEQSLDEMKNMVRRKLGLASSTPIELKQSRYNEIVDLEDDDDFEVFKALTRTSLQVHAIVIVTIPENGSSAIPLVATESRSLSPENSSRVDAGDQ